MASEGRRGEAESRSFDYWISREDGEGGEGRRGEEGQSEMPAIDASMNIKSPVGEASTPQCGVTFECASDEGGRRVILRYATTQSRWKGGGASMSRASLM